MRGHHDVCGGRGSALWSSAECSHMLFPGGASLPPCWIYRLYCIVYIFCVVWGHIDASVARQSRYNDATVWDPEGCRSLQAPRDVGTRERERGALCSFFP